jgi:hypothetical protein
MIVGEGMEMAKLHIAKSKLLSLEEFGFSFVCEMPCSAQIYEAGLVRTSPNTKKKPEGHGKVRWYCLSD